MGRLRARSRAAVAVVSTPATEQPRFELLDAIRFAAASMVVAFHYLFNGVAGGKVTSLTLDGPPLDVAPGVVKYGYLGVPLFFLVSGFVITRSTRGRSADRFVVGRALRLLPAYWCGVLITSTVAVWLGGQVVHVDVPMVLANLTMVPPLFGQPFVDGVYWTLLVELQFYLLVLALLQFGRGRLVERFVPWWALLMLGATAAGVGRVPYLGGYMGFFAAGAVLSTLQQRGAYADGRERLVLLAGLAAAYCVGVQHCVVELPALEAQRHTTYSVPVVVALVTAGHLMLAAFCVPRVARLRVPGARALGSLTYPLYLLHAHLGYMLLNRFARPETTWFVYPALVAGILALSGAVHLVVEKRLEAVWRRLFEATLGAGMRAAAGSAATCVRSWRSRPHPWLSSKTRSCSRAEPSRR